MTKEVYFLASIKSLVKRAELLKYREYNTRDALAEKDYGFGARDPKLLGELNNLKVEANNLILEFNYIVQSLPDNLGISIKELNLQDGLSSLISRGEGLIAHLTELTSPLNLEQNKKIEVLRKRIDEIKCETKIHDNLISSITELENGFFLGSCLISGRIISYCISKLIGDGKKELFEKLKEESKLPTRKEDKDGAEKALIKEILEEYSPEKKYRDMTSHQLVFFPKMEDAFRELSNAIKLVEKL